MNRIAYFCIKELIMNNTSHIVIKNPSKELLDLLVKIGHDKDARRKEAIARWERGEIKDYEVIKI